MAYTYFIISPGAQVNSSVLYRGNVLGNYVKFGDAQSAHEDNAAGIRRAYMTHNPDIGVSAVMDSTAFAPPYRATGFGTQLKNYIDTQCRIDPVGTTEWFSVQSQAAWALFVDMQAFDRRVLVAGDDLQIQAIISARLT